MIQPHDPMIKSHRHRNHNHHNQFTTTRQQRLYQYTLSHLLPYMFAWTPAGASIQIINIQNKYCHSPMSSSSCHMLRVCHIHALQNTTSICTIHSTVDNGRCDSLLTITLSIQLSIHPHTASHPFPGHHVNPSGYQRWRMSFWCLLWWVYPCDAA